MCKRFYFIFPTLFRFWCFKNSTADNVYSKIYKYFGVVKLQLGKIELDKLRLKFSWAIDNKIWLKWWSIKSPSMVKDAKNSNDNYC